MLDGRQDHPRAREARRKYLLRYALFNLRDPALAEDAVQEALIASLAMQRPLARTERLLLGLHLMMCGRCGRFARQIAFLRRAARRLPEALEKDGD